MFVDTEDDRAKVPPYNGNDPPPAPGSLKALLFPPLLNKVPNKGTRGVQVRYGAELPPFISIVPYPARPVILGIVWPILTMSLGRLRYLTKNAHQIYNLLGPLQGSFGPFGPEIPKKSKKKVAGASRPRGQKRLRKSRKKVEKVEKKVVFDSFLTFFRLFSTFFDPGAERPRQLFFDFFGISGLKGKSRMTPVRGQEGCNTK